jgi:hypothetical protein
LLVREWTVQYLEVLMKMTTFTIILTLLATAALSPSYAVDVVNSDEKEYVIELVFPAYVDKVWIAPNETILDVCEDCSIKIGDQEWFSAEGNKIFIITNGKISKGL